MRKFLLAATMMVPFAAFAGGSALSIAGDVNLAKTSAGSTAGVQSTQGTQAQIKAGGSGGVVVGAVSGNYTAVDTSALGKAGPAGSYTDTTATQTNVGGTVAGGPALNKNGQGTGPISLTSGHGQATGASGSAGGGQSSQASGGSAAMASNTNIGGFGKVELPQQGHTGR
jgi:fibronectin-binding autotransporter adhesin